MTLEGRAALLRSPNALAYGTGLVTQAQMARTGLIVGTVGIVLGYVTLILAVKLGLF